MNFELKNRIQSNYGNLECYKEDFFAKQFIDFIKTGHKRVQQTNHYKQTSTLQTKVCVIQVIGSTLECYKEDKATYILE